MVFHTFWIATVKRPNLGADFFSDNEILIDVANTKLILKSGQTLQAQHTRPPLVFGLRLPTEGPFKSLLEEFPGLLSQNFRGKVRHKVQHPNYRSPNPCSPSAPGWPEAEGGQR